MGLRQAQTDNSFHNWVWVVAMLCRVFDVGVGLRQAQTDSGFYNWVCMVAICCCLFNYELFS